MRMMAAIRHSRGRTRGQSLVELALVLPILVTILAAIIEFGWAFVMLYGLGAATRMGARVGSNGGTANDIQYVVNLSKGYSNPGAPIITVFQPNGTVVASTNRTLGNYITVKLVAPYTSFTRLVNLTTLAGITSYSESNTFVISY